MTVGIHWGTFVPTDEPIDAPLARLEKAKKENGIPGNAFVIRAHGETIVLD